MKRFTAVAAVLALSAGSAFAGQDESKQPAAGPVQMTDAQMDSVTAGGLITIFAVDLVDVNNNNVNVDVAANVNAAVAVAGDALAAAAQRIDR